MPLLADTGGDVKDPSSTAIASRATVLGIYISTTS